MSRSFVRKLWDDYPYTVLLLAILLNLLLQPLLRAHHWRVGWLSLCTFMFVLLAAGHATQATRRVRRALLYLAWTAILFAWAAYALRESEAAGVPDWVLQFLLTLRHTLSAAFFGLVTMLLISRSLAPGRINTSRVMAAICAYLFLGILWAEAYGLLTVWYDPVLNLPAHEVLSQVTYFSFVTLTTLGYGDILPIHPLARVLAYLEAVTGVLYLATLVARLVALQIAHGVQAGYMEHQSEDQTDDS